MSNRSGHEEQILIAIDQLRRRKTRTDLEGICNFMQRRFLINPKRTISVLNVMLTANNARVMAVTCKGGKGTSYRRAKPGVASPMKVGDEFNNEVATAVVCGAMSEMINLEPQYLETGVPLDAFEKFLFDKDKVRFSEPMVLALVRAELAKGSVRQNLESGNLELCTQDDIEDEYLLQIFNEAMEEVHNVLPEKKKTVSKDAKRVARNEARKLARREARKEAKREAQMGAKEGSVVTEANGGSSAPTATALNGGTPGPSSTEEAEGGRLRRKRAVRVVFDPSDIPPPPRKKKPPPLKEVPKSSGSHGKSPSENKAGKAPTLDKGPSPGRTLSHESLPISHGKTTLLSEKQLQEKPTAGKKSIPAKGSAEKAIENVKKTEQDSQVAFMKLEKGFAKIHPSIEVKTLPANTEKPAQDKATCDRDRSKAAKSEREKTNSTEKTKQLKVVEVYSSSTPKPANSEKDAAKILMKERAIIQTQNIIQARLANIEMPSRESKTLLQQAKTDKSPPGTDKMAFALAAVCHVCHRPADDVPLMTCTDCANTAHIRCTERRHALRRGGPWRCVHCKTCCVCSETDEYATMVVCCRCEDAYHLSCHPTQEEEEGSANWLCAKCLVLPRDHLPFNENGDELESEGTSGCSTPATPTTPAKAATTRNNTHHPTVRYGPAPCDLKPDPLVPDATGWTVDQVADYFTSRGYHMQGKALRANEVDGSSLLLMCRRDVITGLNLPLGPALKAFRQVRRLQLRQNDDHLLWA